jgi:excisionase family DNA binding protein
MADMLTAKEMQSLLQVDRSTIYRMAEAGQLPAIKVGKQWRFPNDRVENWLKNQPRLPAPALPVETDSAGYGLAEVLPLACIQLIQDAFAELLGIMLVVTDLTGQPITQVSQPCPVYNLLAESAEGCRLVQAKWQNLGQVPALEPRFVPCWGGVLCARALVRMGNELKGMVVASGIAPQDWPPAPTAIAELAHSLLIEPEQLQRAFLTVVTLTPEEQKKVLLTTQRIADILAHITTERHFLLGRLDSIAKLSVL